MEREEGKSRSNRGHTIKSAERATRRRRGRRGRAAALAPRRWARYVWWIFFRRMVVVMAALRSNWEEGSGKIKGQGERPGGEAAQGFYLAWGLHGSGRSCSNEANPGSSCGVWCECLRAGTLTIAGVSFLISPFTTLQNDNQNNSTVLNQSQESSFQVFPNLSADIGPSFASLWVGNEFQKYL